MLEKIRFILVVLVTVGSFLLLDSNLRAQDEMISLAEVAPELVQAAMRYRKFYGDPHTVNGPLGERSYVTGDWGGARQGLIDRGIYSYFGQTQFLEGNVAGGNNHVLRANGSLDYAFWLDSGKAKLWSGGAVYLRGETAWAENKNHDIGSLIPSNIDAIEPSPTTPKTAMSEYYMIQGLGKELMVAAGKMDLAEWADVNLFANNWRYQFEYTALVNNPQLGTLVPTTTYANWWAWTLNEQAKLVYTMNTVDSVATEAGFDTIFNGNMTYSLLLILEPKIFGKPGLYHVLVGYSSKDVTNFAIDPRHALLAFIGAVPVPKKDDDYGMIVSGSQYLWTWDSGYAPDCRCAPSRPLGVGLFFRYGAMPEDRNVISQFASAGLGGYGGPFGRIYDNWGVGWAGSYISPDLRYAASLIENLSPWEHGVEAFYNFRLTPAVHLSFNFQAIDSTVESIDTAYSLGTRLQVDF